MQLLLQIILTATLILPHASAAPLNDIQDYEWQESIEYLQTLNVIQGYNDGTFKPNAPINRAEFTKIIIESLYYIDQVTPITRDCFTDVHTDDWFSKHVCIAKEEGVIDGHPNGRFKPSDTINQAEALKIILTAFYEEQLPKSIPWYQTYLDEAEYIDMYYFSSNNSPASHVLTRGQMAYFIAWLLNDAGTDQIDQRDFKKTANLDEFGFITMQPDDCNEDELYDTELAVCYTQDNNGWESTWYEPRTKNDWNTFNTDEDTPAGSRYAIDGNNLEIIEGYQNDTHINIWNQFTTLIEPAYRTKITEVLFYSADDETSAFVQPISADDMSRWLLAINTTDDVFYADGTVRDLPELHSTLIHEFAHVLTLNDTQINAQITAANCRPRIYLDEGCTNEDSFVLGFIETFWSQEKRTLLTNEDEDIAYELYEQNPNEFVSEYAAVNPIEDMAETFAYFVLQAKPTTTYEYDKKVLYFYEYPSLIQLRNSIRANIAATVR